MYGTFYKAHNSKLHFLPWEKLFIVHIFLLFLLPRLRKDLTLPVLCLASLARSIVGVAGGATKAAVAQHQVGGCVQYSRRGGWVEHQVGGCVQYSWRGGWSH